MQLKCDYTYLHPLWICEAATCVCCEPWTVTSQLLLRALGRLIKHNTTEENYIPAIGCLTWACARPTSVDRLRGWFAADSGNLGSCDRHTEETSCKSVYSSLTMNFAKCWDHIHLQRVYWMSFSHSTKTKILPKNLQPTSCNHSLH